MADALSSQQPAVPPVGIAFPADAAISPSPVPEAAAVVSESGKQLSKEEQMAAFEEDLKYNDWGHQPC